MLTQTWHVVVATLVVLAVFAAAVYAGYRASVRRVVAPTSPSPPAGSSRVLAVLDGKPGSGKTTLCGFLGQDVSIKEKDFDYFTQPVVNPRHPTSKTPEGRARAARWRKLRQTKPESFGPEIDLIAEFVRSEVRDYVASVPGDEIIVFCGVSRWGDYDLLPPEMSEVPRYLLDVGEEETAKRVALRHLQNTTEKMPDCDTLRRTYSAIYEFALLSAMEQSQDPTRYAAVSGDGAELIRAILGNEAPPAAVNKAVSDYRALPTTDQRLRELSKLKFGGDCDLES